MFNAIPNCSSTINLCCVWLYPNILYSFRHHTLPKVIKMKLMRRQKNCDLYHFIVYIVQKLTCWFRIEQNVGLFRKSRRPMNTEFFSKVEYTYCTGFCYVIIIIRCHLMPILIIMSRLSIVVSINFKQWYKGAHEGVGMKYMFRNWWK